MSMSESGLRTRASARAPVPKGKPIAIPRPDSDRDDLANVLLSLSATPRDPARSPMPPISARASATMPMEKNLASLSSWSGEQRALSVPDAMEGDTSAAPPPLLARRSHAVDGSNLAALSAPVQSTPSTGARTSGARRSQTPAAETPVVPSKRHSGRRSEPPTPILVEEKVDMLHVAPAPAPIVEDSGVPIEATVSPQRRRAAAVVQDDAYTPMEDNGQEEKKKKKAPPKRKRGTSWSAAVDADTDEDVDGDFVVQAARARKTPRPRAPAKKKESVGAPAMTRQLSPIFDATALPKYREHTMLGDRVAPEGFVFIRQTSACKGPLWRKLRRCHACRMRSTSTDCLFANIRYFLASANKNFMADTNGRFEPASDPSTGQHTYYLHINNTPAVLDLPAADAYNVPLEQSHVDVIKAVAADALLPTMRDEVEHARLPDVVCTNLKPAWRSNCDCCRTACFNASRQCIECGREICLRCHSSLVIAHHRRNPAAAPPSERDLAIAADDHLDDEAQAHLLTCSPFSGQPVQHSPALFVPITRMSAEHLARVIADLEQVDRTPRESVSRIEGRVYDDRVAYREAEDEATLATAYVVNGDLMPDLFNELWRRGEPVVATGVKSEKGVWTPSYIVEHYGQQYCQVERCATRELLDPDRGDGIGGTRVADFFGQFGKPKSDRYKESCRNKDFPPTTEYQSAFPEEFKDFVKILPAPSYTRPDGVMNIASMFALNGNRVDLGPKGYNATKGDHDSATGGSTRLHCDVADAVNEMPFAQTADGQPGVAIWNLWPAEDSGKLRDYLYMWEARRRKLGVQPTEEEVAAVRASWDDPIHSQAVYVSREMRRELFDMYGVKSWEIRQEAEQAVFIPAGCAHQVSNDADCIKVAIDFVSPHNVDRIMRIADEFRLCSTTLAWKEDILACKFQLYYAWETCRAVERAWMGEAYVGQVQHRLVQRPPPPPTPIKGTAPVLEATVPLEKNTSSSRQSSAAVVSPESMSSSLTTMASSEGAVIDELVPKAESAQARKQKPVVGSATVSQIELAFSLYEGYGESSADIVKRRRAQSAAVNVQEEPKVKPSSRSAVARGKGRIPTISIPIPAPTRAGFSASTSKRFDTRSSSPPKPVATRRPPTATYGKRRRRSLEPPAALDDGEADDDAEFVPSGTKSRPPSPNKRLRTEEPDSMAPPPPPAIPTGKTPAAGKAKKQRTPRAPQSVGLAESGAPVVPDLPPVSLAPLAPVQQPQPPQAPFVPAPAIPAAEQEHVETPMQRAQRLAGELNRALVDVDFAGGLGGGLQANGQVAATVFYNLAAWWPRSVKQRFPDALPATATAVPPPPVAPAGLHGLGYASMGSPERVRQSMAALDKLQQDREVSSLAIRRLRNEVDDLRAMSAALPGLNGAV